MLYVTKMVIQIRTRAHLDDHSSMYKLVAENVYGLSKRPISSEVALCGNIHKVWMMQIKTERRHCQCLALFLKMAPQTPPLHQAARQCNIQLGRSGPWMLVWALPIEGEGEN